ncbi:Ribosome biogenesis protein WDR12 [Araneus ventricosus]|uniref:Ribosome biogenesis protein WDR12 n=1 Tax=Araneus ventricosus TaxID=182803 RepID=A0A4Y2EPZ4_ARAVE|nr:Ribosome biogenesis protein WDR12 [Araneus ventricosus]
MTSQLQIKLVTKQSDYTVPESVLEVPENVSTKELNLLLNSLLKGDVGEDEFEEFDFLLLGELIRTPLSQHIEAKSSSLEQVHEIEYFIKYPAPTPENSLIHDDWISGVDTINKWILTGCYDATVHIWGTDGEHKLTIPGHTAPIKSVAWLKCAVISVDVALAEWGGGTTLLAFYESISIAYTLGNKGGVTDGLYWSMVQ